LIISNPKRRSKSAVSAWFLRRQEALRFFTPVLHDDQTRRWSGLGSTRARLDHEKPPAVRPPNVMQAAYMPNTANDSGAGQFDVSMSGSLVYITGGMFPDLQRALG
jgi:hypothetical protein